MWCKLSIALLIANLLGILGAKADNAIVSFVNFYPGADIYELEGHSALRIRNDHYDVAISYGMFDFNSPNFVYRFVKGETDYMVGEIPWDAFMRQYVRDNRTVVEHVIDLDSAQTERLLRLVSANLLPQNRVYRYNYVKDNCATRPLRMLEAALGDTIQLSQPKHEAPNADTYRQVMAYYHKNYPWYQFGIDLALGSGIDYQLSAKEKAFAPIVLDDQLREATVGGKPLVKANKILHQGADATLGPTPWIFRPCTVAWMLFLAIALVCLRDMRRRKITRWVQASLFAIYGLAGCLLTFLIFVSVHEATSPNWLYLWLNPLCLMVPALIWLKNCNMALFSYQIVNFAMIIALIIICATGVQKLNATFVPLIACDLMCSVSYLYVKYKNRKYQSTH